MSTAWDCEFWLRDGSIYVCITVDLCDLMLGIAWGEADIVVKPVPCLIISIEWGHE
jgi:hypothetical protein